MSLRRAAGPEFTGHGNDDNMGNYWGSGLVDGIANGGGHVTFNRFNCEIRRVVNGFYLLQVVDSGSTANVQAISLATNGDMTKCLIGMGAYVGGAGVIAKLSSSSVTTAGIEAKRLSLVKLPIECTAEAVSRTVALPYHIPEEVDEHSLIEIECKCLQALSLKLMLAKLSGRPYKAILLEYILSGNGTELSRRFLEDLSEILRQYKIVVIADEVMTTGRVGPDLTMTTSMPSCFIKCVQFITCGKVFGCGLVLERIETMQPPSVGTTTKIGVAEAYWKLDAITHRISAGVINRKKNRVHAALKSSNSKAEYWGKGLMIYSNLSRPSVLDNLWNRLLPRLEDDPKTKLVKGWKVSKCNRKTIHDHTLSRISSWLDYMSGETQAVCPYRLELAKFLSGKHKDFVLTPDQMVEHIEGSGVSKCEMVAKYRALKKQKLGHYSGRSQASHRALISRCLKAASEETHCQILSPNVKTKKRLRCYQVHMN
jgi:hypothetical protein